MTSSLNAFRCLPLLFLLLAASCASHPPSPQGLADVEFLNSSTAGHLAFDSGDLPRAQMLYTRALTRARAVNAPDSLVDAACDLAICEVALKHYDAADSLLNEAEYDARRASANPAEIIVLRAKVAYLQGRVTSSAALADAVIDSKADDTVRVSAIILKGQISCDKGDAAGARAQLQWVEKFAPTVLKTLPPGSNADIAKLRGTIFRMEGDSAAAARCFDKEAELLRVSHRFGDMSHALARAADSYESAGKPALAADRFFLAARSIAAQGDGKNARQWLASSIAAAEKAGDPAALLRSNGLLKENAFATLSDGEQ